MPLLRPILPIAVLSCLLLPMSADAGSLFIDFGPNNQLSTLDALNRTWNNIAEGNDVSGSPFTLLDAGGASSGFTLSISNPPGVTNAIGFNGSNANGTVSPTGAALARNYPVSATRDSLYGNTANFNGSIVEGTRLTLGNLNPLETYTFSFFASRTGAGGDNRETEYAVTGRIGGTLTTSSVFLNVAENTGNIATSASFSPDTNGQIVIDIDAGPNNTNTSKFYYLGVLEVTSVPEPSAALTCILGAAFLTARRRRGC